MNKKVLYGALAIIVIVLAVFALIFFLMPKNNKDFKIISVKNFGAEQITLAGKMVNVTLNVPTGKKVNFDNVSITAKEGLTKISGLVLPTGVTKSVQVVMPSGKNQVCVSDSDETELSAICNNVNEVILSCPGSKQGFTCTKVSDTLFEVFGLSHSIIGDFVDCSAHGDRSGGVCACDAGYYGTNCDVKGCKGDTDCDAGYTCDTTKGFCKEKPCASACTYANGAGVCDKGECKFISCLTGWGNCDSNTTNGCETNLQTSNTNCGICGTACAAGSVCTAGACVVTTKPLAADCSKDTNCTSGHCIQSQTKKICASVSSCGACKVANLVGTDCVNASDSTDPKSDCGTGKTCTAGACTTIITTNALGATCSADADCTSAHCLQAQNGKVCASVSLCPACQVISSDGKNCVNASVSTDPKSDCAADSVLTCGNNGFCDGGGACAKYPIDTVCSNAVCSNNYFTAQSKCNFSAACITPSATNCDDGNECTTDTCSASTGCVHTNVADQTPCSSGTGVCTSGACVITPQ